MEILSQQFRAPEIYGDFWFNSDPIPLHALKGYVILLDFWDYTSQSCIRSLPYVKEWYKRYADKGLVTIGVHTPEFPFARDPINVRAAVEQLSLKYPIVMDNDFIVWSAYRNRIWPTKYLVDKNGFVKFVHAGEGSYQNFEHSIQSLLVDSGYNGELPLVMEPLYDADFPGAICYRATPEILTGWQRGSVGNIEGYAPESTVQYHDPKFYIEGRVYLEGEWYSSRDFLRLNEQEANEGYLVVTYQASEVNAVIKPEGEKKFQVFVQADDHYLTTQNKGNDIRLDEEGRSYFLVDSARCYNIVKHKEFGTHKLQMSTRSNGFVLYALSFVSSVIPETLTVR